MERCSCWVIVAVVWLMVGAPLAVGAASGISSAAVERMSPPPSVAAAASQAGLLGSPSTIAPPMGPAQNAAIGPVGVGTLPYGVAYDPAANELYVANSGTDSGSVLAYSTPV